jgi:hypothetical protein
VRKAELNNEIARLVGIRAPKMSTGSTESAELFQQVNKVLGLGLPRNLTKPELARAIVEASGSVWFPDCESRGGTVTRKGLEKVLIAVEFFLSSSQ